MENIRNIFERNGGFSPRPGFYFEDKGRQDRLKEILESWVGTPYRHHCGVRGKAGGTDCIQFVGRVMEEMGVLKNPKFPWYPFDWHLHRKEERLLEGILKALPVVEVDKDAPMNGDIFLFRFGHVSSHAAVWFDGHYYKAVVGTGVIKTHWKDPQWFKRRSHCLRISDV